MAELKILIATTNPGKVKEIKKLLDANRSTLNLFSLQDLNIGDQFLEKGKTFRENAISKSIFYSKQVKDWLTIGEDSGLMVEALNGEPGIYSARYTGQEASDEKNITRLLEKLESVKNRKACFVSIVALSKNGRCIQFFEGRVEGIIQDYPKGGNGFGYDPVFYYPPSGKTFAELTTEEKNKVSHRAQAFQQLKLFLLEMPKF